MSFDCTLHLIDPARIQEALVPRLLGLASEWTAFDDQPDAAGLWADAADALGAGEAEQAANLVCLLAVSWSAAELPHIELRDRAFGLWDLDETDEDALHRLNALAGDPQTLFGDLVSAHPELDGCFPREFDGSYSTGWYVGPERVPELSAWLTEQMAAMTAGEADAYSSLARLLALAATRGFGYWEATDLAVASTHTDWLSLPLPDGVRSETIPFGPRWINVDSSQIWIADYERALVLDTGTGQLSAGTVAPIQMARTASGRPIGLIQGAGPGRQAVTLDDQRLIDAPDPGLMIDGIGRLGDDMYAWPDVAGERPLLRLVDGRWVVDQSMPPASPQSTDLRPAHTTMAGGGVLVWGQRLLARTPDGWRNLVEPTHPLDHLDPPPVRTADGALWAISGPNGTLHRWAGDHAAPIEVIPDGLAQGLAPGQGPDCLVHFGRRDDGLWVALVSPDGRIRGMTRSELGQGYAERVNTALCLNETVYVIVERWADGTILSFPISRLRP